MKKILFFIIILIQLFPQTRKPEVAGRFYSGNASELRNTIQAFLDKTTIQSEDKPIGLIVPHAGYVYSGQVAASAYKEIINHKYETIIILSPSHRAGFDFISVFNGEYYETPLGKIPVNKNLAKELITDNKHIQLSSLGHIKNDVFTQGEHALEVQLPFLQIVQKNVQIVPIVIGTQKYAKLNTLGKKLKQFRHKHNILIIASSDLSHFHNYQDCQKIDKTLIKELQNNKPEVFFNKLYKNEFEACGGSCITALMLATGNNCLIKILKYANSGDIKGGDKSRVVGYTSVAFYEGKDNAMSKKNSLLNLNEQKAMLKLAAATVKSVVMGKEPKIPENLPAIAFEKRGAFVTLTKNQHLRGCIGYILPIKTLYETIMEVGESAALRDPRFDPVTVDELDDIGLEVSVLTVPHKIKDIKQIEVGKHGIIIRQGFYQGLLLPQVATEYGWDRETFLKHTCRKAGLPIDAWKDKNTEIKIFSAQVFSWDDIKE